MSVEVKAGATFDRSVPQPLFLTRTSGLDVSGSRQSYVVSPDGQRILVISFVEGAASTPISVVLNWTAELKK